MKEKKMQAKNGSMVNVHYKGTLTDGTEFDNSHKRGETLSFQIGSGRMIRGFNDAVVGMEIGQTKSITLSPLEAYGPRVEEAQQVVPREAFKDIDNFEIGGMVQGNGPQGPFLAKIKELAEESVTLDLNHPLAGEELNFEIELVSVDETEAKSE
jgi:peptidylprolyl isomerase